MLIKNDSKLALSIDGLKPDIYENIIRKRKTIDCMNISFILNFFSNVIIIRLNIDTCKPDNANK